jgi:hypothetical protein
MCVEVGQGITTRVASGRGSCHHQWWEGDSKQASKQQALKIWLQPTIIIHN